jgi:hypothetical protein
MAKRIKTAGMLLVSLWLAWFALAPSTAFAHAGHNHPVISSKPSQALPDQKPASVPIAHDRHLQTGEFVTSRSLSGLFTSNSAAEKSKGCTNGCCQAAGPSCCPLFFTDLPSQIEPSGAILYFPRLTDRGAGIQPGALPEPPRFLV